MFLFVYNTFDGKVFPVCDAEEVAAYTASIVGGLIYFFAEIAPVA